MEGCISLSRWKCDGRYICRSMGQKNSYHMAASRAWCSDSIRRVALFMVESFPFVILMGTLLGFLSGLGTGGGSLLILWLTLVVGMAQESARIINLLFFIPSALVSCIFRWRQGHLDIKKILPAIIAGSISAALFSILGRQIDTSLLRKCFGFLLLFTGIREIFYRPKA